MIIGIGVDIAEIARVDALKAKYGDRFARRVLTGEELDEYRRRDQSSSYLASRFAAKEAVAKALGTGIGKEFGFQSVVIERDPLGKPLLRFQSEADALVERLNIRNAQISLSDEKHYAVAMVVLES